MRNPNFARANARAQNYGPPLHKILDPPLSPLCYSLCLQNCSHYTPVFISIMLSIVSKLTK